MCEDDSWLFYVPDYVLVLISNSLASADWLTADPCQQMFQRDPVNCCINTGICPAPASNMRS